MKVIFQNRQAWSDNPNVCPHCHVVINPHNQGVIETTDTDNTPTLITTWTCSNDTCNKIFIANYKADGSVLKFDRFLNGLPKGPSWPKPIIDLKSGNSKSTDGPQQTRFIKTYLQSLVAENNGLDELAGMGFRKSIEYLVKDWAIQSKPEDKEKIEKSWLGLVISQYYSGDLKEILERATWLGNDQAHYDKLFQEFDIIVLKELIELIMVELDRQFKMKHYIDSIQKRK